jgi:tetratricopeptide (TPR) repeat protein
VKSLDLWDRPAGQYYTGIYYFGQERYEEALPYYEKALAKLPPSFAPIRLSIAVVYEKTGQKEKAIAFYNHYLRLAPAAAPDRRQVVQAIQALQNQNKAK